MVAVEKDINRLQNNLQAIRKVAGWTTQELGDMIGVTKQTISNIENKKTTMTKTQYIALRTVIDYEIATNEESSTLAQVVQVLLMPEQDEMSEESENKEEQKKKKGGTMGAAAVTTAAIGAVAANPFLLEMSAEWLAKLIKKK